MSNDYEVLKQKFSNFKVFIKEVSRKTDQLSKFALLSDDQWLVLVQKQVVPHFKNNSIDTVLDEMVEYLDIDKTKETHVNKLRRYLECFSEFLLSDQSIEVKKQMDEAAKEMKESDDPYLRELANVKL